MSSDIYAHKIAVMHQYFQKKRWCKNIYFTNIFISERRKYVSVIHKSVYWYCLLSYAMKINIESNKIDSHNLIKPIIARYWIFQMIIDVAHRAVILLPSLAIINSSGCRWANALYFLSIFFVIASHTQRRKRLGNPNVRITVPSPEKKNENIIMKKYQIRSFEISAMLVKVLLFSQNNVIVRMLLRSL